MNKKQSIKEANLKSKYKSSLIMINACCLFVTLVLAKILFLKNFKDFLTYSALMLFTPILFLFILFSAAIICAVYFLVISGKTLKKSDLSQKKKVRLFILSLSNFLIYFVIWILLFPISSHVRQNRWENYSDNIKPKIVKEISDKYTKAGFSNFKIKINKIERYQTMGSTDHTVKFTYSEKIGNRTFKSKQEIAVDRDTLKIDDFFSNEISGDITEDSFEPQSGSSSDITANAAFFQPEVENIEKRDGKILSAVLKKDQIYLTTYGTYNNLSKKQLKMLKDMVLANRKKHLPLGGFYNLDFDKLTKEKIVLISTEVKIPRNYTKDDYRYTVNQLNKIDASKLQPGIHEISFEHSYHHKNSSGTDVKAVSFIVENGIISRITLDEY